MQPQNRTKSIDKELLKKLWNAADALRGNISSEQYMLIVIGILFLNYVSSKFTKALNLIQNNHPKFWKTLKPFFDKENNDTLSKILKDSLLVKYDCSFFIPSSANWKEITKHASLPTIGYKLDQAFLEIEKYNSQIQGLLEKNYNRRELDQSKLGQVVSEFENIDLTNYGEDVFGRIYEYFLGHFFKKQGQKGGEFYTPSSVVDLLVRLIDPREGTIYDPACGTGGMFVQAISYMKEKKLDVGYLNVYGQEYQNKIWKLAKINLLVHNFHESDINLGAKSSDTFSDDQHKQRFFDYALVNPPFNMKKWGLDRLEDDPRWQWGKPPKNNANYAWISHILSKLTKNGRAGIVLANGSLSSQDKAELTIRKKLVEENKVDAIITLPEKLFYTTQIPACLWIFNNNKSNREVLMIHGTELEGNMINKRSRELTKDNINKIVSLYHKHKNNKIINKVGFAKSINEKEIMENDYSFLPGRYVDFIRKKNDKHEIEKNTKKIYQDISILLNEFDKVTFEIKRILKKLKNEK